MQKRELNPVAVELAATKLVLRALVAHLLVDDPDEADGAIDALIARVDAMAGAASVGAQDLSKADAAAAMKAIRSSAVAFLAGMKRGVGTG